MESSSGYGLFLPVFFLFLIPTSANFDFIPLTKCCRENSSYTLGHDFCDCQCQITSKDYTFKNFQPYLPIYSIDGEGIVQNPRIQLSYNLPNCPAGFIHSVSTNFFIFENGTVSIPELGIWKRHDQFCTDEFITFNPVEPVKAFVRFCVSDPCLNASACIRKCCPKGMINYFDFYTKRTVCRITDTITFDHNTIRNVTEIDVASYVIRNGIAPRCAHGAFPFDFGIQDKERSLVHLNQNGSIFMPRNLPNRQLTDEYCIDYTWGFHDHRPAILMGYMCRPPLYSCQCFFIQPYLNFVSSAFLVATFIVYALIPELRNVHGLCVMCHVASLAVYYVFEGIGFDFLFHPGIPRPFCYGKAVVGHFISLSPFSWLNVISFYTWWKFRNLQPTSVNRNKKDSKRHFLYCSIYGWGFPLIVVLVGQILDGTRTYDIDGNPLISTDGIIRPDFGVSRCGFPTELASLVYVNGPIGILILTNVTLFFLTITAICQASKETQLARKKQTKQKIRIISSLFVLMGLSWIMDITKFLVGGDLEWIMFINIFISLMTGVVVFIMFVCKPTVWNRLKKRFPFLSRLDCHPSCCKKQTVRCNPI